MAVSPGAYGGACDQNPTPVNINHLERQDHGNREISVRGSRGIPLKLSRLELFAIRDGNNLGQSPSLLTHEVCRAEQREEC